MAIQANYTMALQADQTAPSVDAYNLTPTNGLTLTGGPCRALYIGVTGTVTITTKFGNTVLFTAVPAGSIIPVQALTVEATGTTASSIVAMY